MHGISDSAEYYLKSALNQDSTHPQAYYYLGMHYANNKQPLPAIQNLEASLKYYPDPKYLKNIYILILVSCILQSVIKKPPDNI